jgi:2'-5' RNA ligase
MPAPADGAAMQRLVDDLAGRFAGPRFKPHLTLAEEQDRGVAELAAACRSVAAGTERFSATVEAIAGDALYFRSLYALFRPNGALADLRRGMVAALAREATGAFMPHISLAYGVEPGLEKEQARIALARDLAGKPIAFDRICVVASAKTIPVAEWAIQSTAPLHPAPGP